MIATKFYAMVNGYTSFAGAGIQLRQDKELGVTELILSCINVRVWVQLGWYYVSTSMALFPLV
jgi:hypothetical protein